jgi:HSP20 family protein
MKWLMMTPFSGRGEFLPGDHFTTLQRHLSRAFDDALGDKSGPLMGKSMHLDVKEDDKAYDVMTELPGLSKEDIDISYEDGLLTIRGEKKIERDEKKGTWHIVERSSGSFVRQLRIPSAIKSDKIEAKYDKGVLTVTLPKEDQEKTKSKKISVKDD